MYGGSLPPTTVYSTWVDNIELLSADDDTPWDTSMFTEVQVVLRDPVTMVAELTLKLTEGRVTLPAPGIIQWRAEADTMSTLMPILYETIIILEDNTDTVVLYIGSISVIQ